jgi:hypothetical protein
MDGRQAKREAKFRAGLILESALASGWQESIEDRYGARDAERIADELQNLATRLIESSGPRT